MVDMYIERERIMIFNNNIKKEREKKKNNLK